MIQNAMHTSLGADPEEAQKLLAESGIGRKLAGRALEIGSPAAPTATTARTPGAAQSARRGPPACGLGDARPTGQPILVRYGRVKLGEQIAERLQTDLIVYLIGERPGGDALASRSLSAYLIYRLGDAAAQQEAARFSGNPAVRFEYTVISNIYRGGLPSAEAAAVVVDKVGEILNRKAAGNRLGETLKG